MEKVAVYTGTRNLYFNMFAAAKSLLIHSDVDKIYFLIEDDTFPYELPPEIQTINISNQTYFKPDGPNFNSKWTYMVLIRVALSKIFPQYDKILSLDCDTIVMENISDLWDIDISNYYVAGAREARPNTPDLFYINFGVVLLNLKALRESGMDDKVIEELNTRYYELNEQDCINTWWKDKILELSPDYNVCYFTKIPQHRKILHFAYVRQWEELPEFKYYAQKPLERNVQDNIKLDIIIPTYKDKEGLRTTLKSINWQLTSKIDVTVVDDYSELDYSDIQQEFPNINLILCPKNGGPGIARQIGINNTHNSHIMFIDSGDYLLSKFNLFEVLATIESNTVPYLYQWRWLNEETNMFSKNSHRMMHGMVYSREFLNIHDITFGTEMPYSNEDIGFNHTCYLIIQNLVVRGCYPALIEQYDLPIYFYTYNSNSLVHKDNNAFMHKNHIPGLTRNIIHCIDLLENEHVAQNIIIDELNHIIAALYYYFLRIVYSKPDALQENWNWLHKFYIECYSRYPTAIDDDSFITNQSRFMPSIRKLPPKISINLRRFIFELKEETVPDRYFV